MRRRCAVAIASAVVLAGCGTGSDDSPAQAKRMIMAKQPASTVAQTNAANEKACVEDPDHKVTMLDPVVIPEVRVEPTTFDSIESDGATVAGALVPGFVVKETTISTGCIIEETARPGCLGAVTITGYEIPPVRVPGVELPARRLPDGTTQEAVSRPPVIRDGIKREPVRRDAQCQVTTSSGRSAAVRGALVRGAGVRGAGVRSALVQPTKAVRVTNDAGDTVPFAAPPRTLPPVAVAPVSVPPVSVPPAVLPHEPLERRKDVDVAEGQGTTAYVAPSKVLFDEDKSELRPAATAALRAIVAALEKKAPTGEITVDGYTDNQGSEESGLVLSRARAQAVKTWLIDKAGIEPDRIAAVNGYGEARPAAPNDSEANMAKNRRVVISVAS